MGRSSTTIGQPGQTYARCSRIWLTGASSVGKSLVGREGIEPPQSKTADLQSAELTTCSTYPRITAGAWCVDGGRWYQTDAVTSTDERVLEPREGVEPTTYCLQNSCSAIELPRHCGAECSNSAAASGETRVDRAANRRKPARHGKESADDAGDHRVDRCGESASRGKGGSGAAIHERNPCITRADFAIIRVGERPRREAGRRPSMH